MSSQQTVLFDVPGPKARRRILMFNIVGVIFALGVVAYLLFLTYQAGQFEGRLWEPFIRSDTWEFYFIPGLINTLKAAVISVITATVFGTLFGVGRLANSRIVRWICGLIVEFFRAVPVLIMMVAGWLLFIRIDAISSANAPFYAVVVALTLYNGAVIAELVRSGVHGLPKGQREAGLAIGMTRGKSIRHIELPQALLAMLPSLVSQFVVILKDSALGYIVTYPELLRQARLIGSNNPLPIVQSLLIAAVIFIILNFMLTKFAEIAAHRVSGRTSGKTRVPTGPAQQVEVAAAGVRTAQPPDDPNRPSQNPNNPN